MSLILLVVGASLSAAAEYPMPKELLYPCIIYAVVYDFLGGVK